MAHYFSTTIELPFNAAIGATIEALTRHGFGVLTPIDVQATLKKKLDVYFRPYRLLGACILRMAYQALLAKHRIGTMLPCNFIVQQREGDKVAVSAVDFVASMMAIEYPKLEEAMTEIREMLRRVIEVGVAESRTLA